MSNQSSGQEEEEKIVFPSELIGVEEQFRPSENSTYIENHEVRAAVAGKLFIDKRNYRAKVFPFNKGVKVANRKDTVIATVIRVSRSSVRLEVGYINKTPISPPFSAIMHISDASTDYVKNLDDYFVAGDVIRARVIDAKTYPIQLECSSRDLGVISASCIKCASKLEKIKKNKLKCKECDWEQSRGTAIDYGNVSFIPDY